MFNIRNIVTKITDRGRESNPNSPGRNGQDDDGSSNQRAEGFLCPTCMKAFTSPTELQSHYELLHAEETGPDGASPAGFLSMHQEVGERYKQHEDGGSSIGGVVADTVSSTTNVQELQKFLQESLESKRALQIEKDHLEQRAAQLAQLNATLRAECDDGHSAQVALMERLKFLETQLSHRESIDDAAVLRQELVQVQRVMDELNREREQERDALRAELQLLKSEHTQEMLGDVSEELKRKEIEISQLVQELEISKKKCAEFQARCEGIKESNHEIVAMKDEIISLSEKHAKDVKALEYEIAKVLAEKETLQISLRTLEQTAENDKKSSIQNLENILSRLDALTIVNDECESKLKCSQNELNVVSKQRDELKSEVGQYRRQIEELKQLNLASENKIGDLTLSLTRSKDKISQSESEHAELVAQIQAGEGATTAIQQLTQENNSLQSKLHEEMEQHSAHKEELVHTIQEVKSQLSESERNKHELEQELKNEKILLSNARSEIHTMAEKLKSFQRVVKEKEASMEQLSTSNQTLKTSLENITKMYADLEKELKDKSSLLSELTAKMKTSKEKFIEAQQELERLHKLKSKLNSDLEESSTVIAELNTELNTVNESRHAIEQTVIELQQARQKMEKEVISIKTEKDALAMDKASLEEKLKEFEDQLQVIGVQRASLETSLFELQISMADLETEKKDFEEEKNKEIGSLKNIIKLNSENLEKQEEVVKILMEEKLNLTKQIEEMKETQQADLNSAQQEYSELKTELDSCSEAKKTLQKDLASEVERRKNLEEENEKLSTTLERTVKESSEKEKSLQAMLDEITGEKLALEVQLETSQTERQTLLERYIASTSETEGLHRTIADLRRKWDESQAALHELGRENQTLQLDIEKLIGRKWAEDSEVTQCTLCNRDFTMIMRKHHCRNCGQIFCNECSSKTAPIASNKKPVRVCDSCYSELAPK